jgi:signal transduction histidine kinase
MADSGKGWPCEGGLAAALLRAPGFEAAGLGPVAGWTAALRRTLDLMFASEQRMIVIWGPEWAYFYNEAIRRDYPKTPVRPQGRRYADNFPAIMPQFGPFLERVFAGEAQLHEDLLVEGMPDDLWVTVSFTPVRDEDGSVGGALGVMTDVSERMHAAAREHAIMAELAEKSRMLEIVNGAGMEITGELDTARVAQIAVDAGVALTGAQFGAFFYNVTDGSGESYMLYTISGVDRAEFEKFPMPRNTQVFAPTFNGEGIVRSDDITQDPRYGHNAPNKGMPPGHLPVRSYLAVPVKSPSGEVIGGLFYGHEETGRFNGAVEASLASLAGQAALAMDNARLFQSAKREIGRRGLAERLLRQLNESLEGRVQSEIEVRQAAEAALQQAQKMETIGKLTGGVAHDFNNLLQVISGNLQMLERDVAGNAKAERRVENALAGVTRGAKLASQLLAFGRRQPLEPRVLNIGRFLGGMDDMLRRTLGEAIEIEIAAAPDLWNAMADPAQIENAVLNLAINARDAMDEAGKLTIAVSNAFLDADAVRAMPDMAAGHYVLIAVTDTGCGMAPEVAEQAFEPFFSTKAEGKGSGLGLSMVYGFVKQSGGHVRIESAPGAGTTVKLYMPRVRRREDSAALPEDLPAMGGSETILVAEDDEAVRATVVGLLEELGYRVLTAADARGALEVIESGVAIDLLFTDVVMPGPLKSPELARKARRRLPEIGVLFTSGYTEDAIVHGGKLDAGVELLSKPYTREALARRVRAVLAGKR